MSESDWRFADELKLERVSEEKRNEIGARMGVDRWAECRKRGRKEIQKRIVRGGKTMERKTSSAYERALKDGGGSRIGDRSNREKKHTNY